MHTFVRGLGHGQPYLEPAPTPMSPGALLKLSPRLSSLA